MLFMILPMKGITKVALAIMLIVFFWFMNANLQL